MGKILQYELWQECNNFCDYCTLGKNNECTSDDMKLEAIHTAITELQALVKGEVSTVGFIGGEFFQGQLHSSIVKGAFMSLVSLVNQLLNDDIIEEVWFNATLTIGEQKDLYATLDMIDKKNRIWVLTSYDTIGRFHTATKLHTWKYHMLYLHKHYPDVRINTTSIITGNFIQSYMNDELDLNLFKHKYNTTLFLKTPVKPDDWCDISREEINNRLGYQFFPRKIDFLKFLLKYKEKEGEWAYKLLFSNDLKAEELHKNFNDEHLRNITFIRTHDFKEDLDCDQSLKVIETLSCGHSNVYQCYVDSDDCAICDKIRVSHL